MFNDVFLFSWDGIGGSLLTAQAASFVKAAGKNPIILCPSRDEVFLPFSSLIKDQFVCEQVPEEHPKWLMGHGKKAVGIDNNEEAYLVYPDGLHTNPFAFDFRKYNTNLQTLKSTRILTHKYKPTGKQIYVGLISSTEGYVYDEIPKLVELLATKLPDYTIHYPTLSKWADIKLNQDKIPKMPDNVIIHNSDIFSQIELLSECEYGIFTDNGFSHISYHLGQNRLLIDPRFGFNRNSTPWVARWRETTEDSIRFNTSPEDISDLVKINIEIPQTTLLPKQVVLNNKHENWPRELIFKF